jgi:hypothetical protein
MNPTYLPYDSATNKMPVLLEGKIVGHIRAHAWGWWYVPVGQTKGGDTFKDIAAVKRSLEMEPEEGTAELGLAARF